MSEIENTTILGLRCDKRCCEKELRGPEMARFPGLDYYHRLAIESGWTLWAGRSRMAYCPDHGPSRGSKMHALTLRTEGVRR